MPLQATSGAASYDAFGGGVPVVPAYIEEVFSTYLHTGTGSAQTITNGIDLSGKGGLVWTKGRSVGYGNGLFDTIRGSNSWLNSASTDSATSISTWITSFNSNGFGIGTNGSISNSGTTYASWTFRKQPKFFDVVTYTGNGTSKTITHNLGSTPACIITKRTDTTSNWLVYHRSIPTQNIYLNKTDAAAGTMGITSVGSTTYAVNGSSELNENGGTYVAYIYAHDAGGFGLTGTDNVISCGSYTGNGSTTGPVVTLGYEPQWLLVKRSSASGDDWILVDNMRGFPVTGNTQYLNPNNSFAESSFALVSPLATGFQPRTTDGGYNANGSTYIYIAIRRGPMKVPTSGTSVFAPIDRTGTGSATTQETGLNGTDLAFTIPRTAAGNNWQWVDRLRGGVAGSARRIQSNNTSQEFDDQSMSVLSSTQTTISYGGGGSNGSGVSYIVECFKRAPSVFDVVCYTGTGSNQSVAHNLKAVPELVIYKKRNAGQFWYVLSSYFPDYTYSVFLDTDGASSSASGRTSAASDTSYIYPTGNSLTGNAGDTYVAYLFASCAGVSKVGSYTGNGSSQTINCGFTGGARFVMIKATSTTGDWMVADSARGIVSGSDPYLELNNTNAEVTGEDWLDTDSTGFVVNQVSASNANTNGVTYIFLAIA
jgi:hypothetical protein